MNSPPISVTAMTYILLMDHYDVNHKQKTLAYFSGKNSAIENAREFARYRKKQNDPELSKLASDIKKKFMEIIFLQI